jgi:hypothetical protein
LVDLLVAELVGLLGKELVALKADLRVGEMVDTMVQPWAVGLVVLLADM